MKNFKLNLLGCLILAASSALQCQTYSFENYSSEENVNPFVYNLLQDNDGILLIGTGDGLIKYDGLDFQIINKENGLGGDIVSCSYLDKEGVAWLGHSKSGKITTLKKAGISILDISDFIKNKVNGIVEDEMGNVWVASQNEGLLCIKKDGTKAHFKEEFKDYMLLSIHNLGGNAIALGTNEGVFMVSEINKVPKISFLDEGPYTKVFDFHKIGPNHILTTEDDGLYNISYHKGQFSIQQVNDEFNWSSEKLVSITGSTEKEIFISTPEKIYSCSVNSVPFGIEARKNLNSGKTLGSTNIRNTLLDRENNLWIASFGDGLFRMSDEFFTFYDMENDPEVLSIYSHNNEIMVSTKGNLYFTETGNDTKGILRSSDLNVPSDSITAILKETNGTLWLGTRFKGVYYTKDSRKLESFHLSNDINARRINCLEQDDVSVYVGTSNGLYIINKKTKDFELLNSQVFGHNVINNLYKDKSGIIWVATLGQEIIYFENGVRRAKKISDKQTAQIEAVGIAHDKEGNVWVATATQGVVKLGEENIQFDKNSGLHSSSTYGVVCDKNGFMWITHRDGLSKINPENYRVEIFNHKNGIGQDFSNAITVDQFENIWFGSNEGVLKYNPDLDKTNLIAPKVVFSQILLSDSIKHADSDWNLDYGDHKIQINFKGVTLNRADEVLYSYYLEGHDEDWGDYTSNKSVSYNKLPSGEYTFKVTALNADDVGGEKISELKFTIDSPIWQKPWFVITVIVLSLVTLRLVIHFRERRLKERQIQLEAQLDARTEEVVNKNLELEEKNKDITDSINYAKNIQNALIPSDEELKKSFSQSFVFFKPRDIVSGDFYWVKRFRNSSVIVGADCTGHGVPGAFISLIGMSVLKEISSRKATTDPAIALNFLEVEIENTLNKNKAYGVKDGMDLGIIEINHDTLELRYSAARRPLVIYRKGNFEIINGDRQSIGGSYEDEPLKEFTLKEYQLEKGDRLYLWSDGYPDQFGGPRAKKLKQKGLLEILTKMQDKPIETHHNIIRESFLTWKNGYEQVDDVLLLGIEI